MKRKRVLLFFVPALLSGGFAAAQLIENQLEGIGPIRWLGRKPIQELGQRIFFDQNLSINRNQSCAACHARDVGWTGATSVINATGSVYEGSVPGRFGNRKPPAAAYAGDSSILHQKDDGTWAGGMFWDGRATGWTLADPLAEQAKGPFLNPLEQGLPSAEDLVARVCASSYAHLFRQVWGGNACSTSVDVAYDRIARSVAAYERSVDVNTFTSKYDHWVRGEAVLTAEEHYGRQLFAGQANCAGCHVSTPGPQGKPALFTDYTYDNLGIPRNPLNPFYYQWQSNSMGAGWVDEGLGGFLRAAGQPYETELGKFKVPTLRNVDLRTVPHDMVAGESVKAFGHNGYFKSLKEIVHFYNTRDVLPTCAAGTQGEKVTCWPAPEHALNVNRTELGNLGLTGEQEDAIVAFLKTLSDGHN